MSHFVSVVKCARDQCSILNNFALTPYGLLFEWHALACSYALLIQQYTAEEDASHKVVFGHSSTQHELSSSEP